MEVCHNRDTLGTQGYRVESTQTGEQVANICSIFKYKGFEIRFSTHDYDKTSAAAHRVALFHDNPAYFNIIGKTYPSVEDAIKAADHFLQNS